MCITRSGKIYGWGFGGALNSRVGLGAGEGRDQTSEPATHSHFLTPVAVVSFPMRARLLEEQDSRRLGFPAHHLNFSGCEFDAQKSKAQGHSSNTSSSGRQKGDSSKGHPEE